MTETDILIIGAGIAGASLAAAVEGRRRVVLVETEDVPGRHSTGRSAAFYDETYGGPGVQPLTSASGPLLREPRQEMGGRSFLRARGGLIIARDGNETLLDTLQQQFDGSGVRMDRLARPALHASIGGLRSDWSQALLLPDCEDIDVAALHQAFLAKAKRQGVHLLTRTPFTSARVRSDGTWEARCGAHTIIASTIVNAAGAWADDVATMAGARPLNIRPFRRTIAQIRLALPTPAKLPLVIDSQGQFYFKGEGEGRIWLSPHDETPDLAHDVAAEEEDVALAIDRLQQVVDWPIAAVEHRWAGLRSFAPDRLPVYGFASETPEFFWCAGQGGFGIQTAPAAAALSAALLLDVEPDQCIAGLEASAYSPSRPALA